MCHTCHFLPTNPPPPLPPSLSPALQSTQMMRQGGNAQLRDYFRKLQLPHSGRETERLFGSKAAVHYRVRRTSRLIALVSCVCLLACMCACACVCVHVMSC